MTTQARIEKENREATGRIKPKRVSDPAHLARVRRLPCCVCGKTAPSHAHHINIHTMGRKAGDREVIPLCWDHHQGNHGVHSLGTRAWEKQFGPESEFLRLLGDQGHS